MSDDQVYGAVGAALSALLTGGLTYWRTRRASNADASKGEVAVALAQSQLAAYISQELEACHKQHAETHSVLNQTKDDLFALKRRLDETVAKRERQIAELNERLNECLGRNSQ